MDIRQLIEEKPRLGRHAEIRFAILHNLRILQQLEQPVAEHLVTCGPLTVATREHCYELSLEGQKVNVIIRSGRPAEGLAYLDAPHPVQLFCNEASLLHRNQLQFLSLTEGELRAIRDEFLGVAKDKCLFVEKGRFNLKIHRDCDRLCFDACSV